MKGMDRMLLELERITYLGPARVLRAQGSRAELELPDCTATADVAVAFPYRIEAGDTVLAIGQGEAWYVIGILQGSGKTSLVAPADIQIAAPRGKIEILAAKGITLKGPEVRITAGKLEIAARSVLERFQNATRWVKEAFQVRAGRMRTQVSGDWRLKADTITERSDGDVKIDGRKIHLG